MIVLDTNVVLDLLVFDAVASAPLKAELEAGHLQWLATLPMRDELQRVLGYGQIVLRLALLERTTDQVLAQFDRMATLQAVAPKAPVTCSDPDDQKFIDLAVSCRAMLLSKDRAVLSMSKRLLAYGVSARSAMN